MPGTILVGDETNGKYIFEGRERYSEYINDYTTWFVGNKDIDHNFINLWERGLYGKIDTNKIPIIVKPEKITEIENTEPVLFALDFVYAMFVDMKRYFFNITSKNNIKTERFWSGKISKGWTDTLVAYSEYRRTWDLGFWRWYYNTNQNIKNNTFDKFLNSVLYYKKYIQSDPITLSGWVASVYAPYGISGLILEITEEMFRDDEKKINSFFDKNVYSVFAESARRFGFLIDQNAPWRLVADIDSIATQYYIMRSWEYSALKTKYTGIPLYNSGIATDLDAFIQKYANYDEYSETLERIKTQDIIDEYFIPSYSINGNESDMLWENFKAMYLKDKVQGCTSYPKTQSMEFYAQLRETEFNGSVDLVGYVKKYSGVLDNNKILGYMNSKATESL